jgi:hypothetical protein
MRSGGAIETKAKQRNQQILYFGELGDEKNMDSDTDASFRNGIECNGRELAGV